VVSLGNLSPHGKRRTGGGDLTVTGQSFMVADVLSGGSFAETLFDGVMGLARGGADGRPFYLALRDRDLLQEDCFSFYFSNTPTAPGHIFTLVFRSTFFTIA